jgi:hypothetical protein
MLVSERRILGMMLTGSLALAGCGGGGGGNLAGSIPTNPPAMGPPPMGPVVPANGAPAFDGADGVFPAPNTSFSAITTDGIPLTVTILSASPTSTTFQITDSSGTHNYFYPATLTYPGAWQAGNGIGLGAGSTDTPPAQSYSPWGLSYVSLGEWNTPTPTASPERFFVFGFDTPVSSIPVSGNASFQGQGMVRGIVAGPNDVFGVLQGDANLNVNFTSGQVGGKLTNISAVDPCTAISYPWNDVSVNASIAAGTNKFSGTTGAASQPVSPYALKSTATGKITGAFYGPAANNLGALWTLNDGTLTASGGVAAAR